MARKKGAKESRPSKVRKVGSKFTKTISRGPNKGDRVQFKVASGGKPFPVRVLKDKGSNSTLKNNAGVKFGKKKKKK